MAPLEQKEEGNRLFGQKEWAKAAEAYTKGLHEGGEELSSDLRGLLLSNRSQCALNLGQWERAFEDASACLRLLPEHTKSIFRRGQAHEKLGRESEALADFAQVAKAEPGNKAAAEATRRLRDKLLREGQQRRDEVLPAHLLQVLRRPHSETEAANDEQKVDACAKLRGLCVHKGLVGALLSAGALETLVETAASEEATPELREGALAALVTLASGYEAGDDEDAPPKSTVSTATGPLPVPPAAAEARRRLKDLLPIDTLRRCCRGCGPCLRRLAALLGLTHELEDTAALEAIHDSLAFLEGGEVNVPRSGVVALALMCDTRRRLGKHGKPVVSSAALLKCVETAMGTTSCVEPLRSFVAGFFALLSDGDRPKDMEVDVGEIAGKVLEPFLQAGEPTLRANGLAAFCSLFAANGQAAMQVLHGSAAPLSAVLNAISHPPHGPEGLEMQSYGTECLLLAMGNKKTRQCLVEGGGIDMLLGALGDGEAGSKGIVRAKLIAVLSMIAGHNKEVREEVFDRMDILVELRFALDASREHLHQARAGGTGAPSLEDARRLCRGLYESCACLSIHGEFKELLVGARKTLTAMQDLLSPDDLMEDANLSFLYASLMYNLCRSRDDKVRPKRDEFPFNELGEDDLKALEEFYDKMPAESRPEKNGEVDAGSKELADKMRSWCVHSGGQTPAKGGGKQTGSSVVAHLVKCAAGGSTRAKNLVAFALRFLCAEQEHRRHIVTSGGLRALLGLVDLEEELARDAARQALAQICIVTNPTLFSYSEQLDAVRPLVQTLEHRHELLQFEAAMGLTNLLTVSDDLRSRALQANAWSACRDLLFSENEMVQRAGVEAMCNLTMAPETVERFVTGKGENDLQILLAFCLTTDHATQAAASGALAMLAAYNDVAVAIASNQNFGHIVTLLKEATSADLQHRAVSVLSCVCECEGAPAEAVATARGALAERREAGFKSQAAEQLALSALGAGGG